MKHLNPSTLTQEAKLADEMADLIVEANKEMHRLTWVLVVLTAVIAAAQLSGLSIRRMSRGPCASGAPVSAPNNSALSAITGPAAEGPNIA